MRTRHIWTAAEDANLRRLYPDTPNVKLAAMFGVTVTAINARGGKLGLRKSSEYLAEFGVRLRTVGISGRFPKGHVPWNTGKKIGARGRAVETQFKKGQRPHTWVPIGTEVIRGDGYLVRKISDNQKPGESRFNWKTVHVLMWEEANGPVQKGHVLRFRNGDKTDVRLDNLELITRAENGKRNTIHRYPAELKEVIRLKARVQRQINKRRKRHEDEDRKPA